MELSRHSRDDETESKPKRVRQDENPKPDPSPLVAILNNDPAFSSAPADPDPVESPELPTAEYLRLENERLHATGVFTRDSEQVEDNYGVRWPVMCMRCGRFEDHFTDYPMGCPFLETEEAIEWRRKTGI